MLVEKLKAAVFLLLGAGSIATGLLVKRGYNYAIHENDWKRDKRESPAPSWLARSIFVIAGLLQLGIGLYLLNRIADGP